MLIKLYHIRQTHFEKTTVIFFQKYVTKRLRKKLQIDALSWYGGRLLELCLNLRKPLYLV